ncbi:MAG TPA: Ig-like domain-containing protein, partial [Candidatus Dormibacteraeota bacterium]|nr:Ig-like domain-containing protein [Candidatus Dormibacteraeota bacterium]
GEVEIAWANGHGITDFGFPSDLAFNELNPDAQWEYQLVDRTPPTLATRTPAPGTTVTNLTQVSVTFSEPVTGVDAADLLINGTPALALAGSGTNYTFDVAPPAAGTVTITWATNHGIFDQAETPNAFVGSSANATWSFVLDTRVVLVQSNSIWNFVKGFVEASTPSDAWRQPGFDDSGWSNSAAPFFYGDPYDDPFSGIFGTLLSDMRSNYTTVFLRKEFVVENRSTITNLLLNHQSDDGFIAWINGVEVLRYNVSAGELPYNAVASSVAPEPDNVGAAYIVASLVNNAVSRLVRGTNILAVQAFNQSLTLSSDFGFNAQLYYFPANTSAVPPRLASADPA